MVNVSKRIVIEFEAPKVRESFMRSFVDNGSTTNNGSSLRLRKPMLFVPQQELSDIALLTGKPAAKSTKVPFKRNEIYELIM